MATGTPRTGTALFDLTGRTALVTGSSQGIGRALAQGLAEAGATVVVHGRDRAKAERAAGEIAASTGRETHVAIFDVTDAAAVDAGVAEVETRLGTPDILVNNAGIQRRSPTSSSTTPASSAAARSPSSPIRTGTISSPPT